MSKKRSYATALEDSGAFVPFQLQPSLSQDLHEKSFFSFITTSMRSNEEKQNPTNMNISPKLLKQTTSTTKVTPIKMDLPSKVYFQ